MMALALMLDGNEDTHLSESWLSKGRSLSSVDCKLWDELDKLLLSSISQAEQKFCKQRHDSIIYITNSLPPTLATPPILDGSPNQIDVLYILSSRYSVVLSHGETLSPASHWSMPLKGVTPMRSLRKSDRTKRVRLL